MAKKRILWISDIHLSNELISDTKKAIDSFIEAIRVIDPSPDYLIITGDIALDGEMNDAYDNFKLLIIDKVKKIFTKIIVLIVPGNHDVIWSQAKSYFIEKLISGTKLSDVLLSIDKRYFRSCFREYIGFHKANASVPIDSKCFSHTYTDDEELNFICLNSAWLSVGNPVHEANIKMRQIQKTISHDIFTEDGKSMIFSELGNQSYGFKIKGIVSESLDSIRTTLSHKTLRDKFNIILVHHPPNNWLRWDELYDEGATVKGPLHTFIKSCSVDMVCCGHEHTSQVEGGVIFGQTLVLNGGMFLDHRQENYTNMWFKLLEINTDEKSVEETPFLYHQADEKWNSQSGLKYCGWSSVYTRKSDQNNSKAPANSNETWDPHTQKRKDLEFHPQSIQDLLEFLLEPMQGLHVIIEQLSRKMGMKSNLKPDVVELNKTRQLNIIEWEDKILILLSVNEILNLAIDKKHINFFSDICTVVKERFLKSGSCIVFLSYYSIDVKNEGSVDRLSSLIQKVLVGIFRNYNFATLKI